MRAELIVGCYTKGDYEQEARGRLIPSLNALGLPNAVYEVPDQGNWVANGFACQDFILQMHQEQPEVDLLFLDVDAVVHSDPWPLLRKLDCDLAAHLFKGTELLTGTLYLPAIPRREELLTRWIGWNRGRKRDWDQINLQCLLASDRSFRFSPLPAEYCCIFDLQRKYTPDIVPVIEHFQASRRLRRRADRRRAG